MNEYYFDYYVGPSDDDFRRARLVADTIDEARQELIAQVRERGEIIIWA